MSRDPYVDVKREIESSLSSLQPLTNQFDRLSSQPSTPAYAEVRDQVRETLTLLEADLEDLDESVRVVEATGERWGIGEEEVRRRRGFVEKVRREVDRVRNKLSTSPKGKQRAKYQDHPEDLEAQNDNEVERWEREEQQVLLQRQDDTLGVIAGTLNTLASQAGLIGHEVVDQNVYVFISLIPHLASDFSTLTHTPKHPIEWLTSFAPKLHV
ncbi:hypothetical protein M231_00610 [Tremella mesenterica]|uniref:Syntaxin 6/10/61 N-terminal domain-containing protein n=1 Tax=Tremella mesenterica TaxID=5217 RepID=A0A4Q1BVT6_TREME|nr:hypothetical protein M231_00610 [Tremella mesenterica]